MFKMFRDKTGVGIKILFDLPKHEDTILIYLNSNTNKMHLFQTREI